jgi:hypothetical protein
LSLGFCDGTKAQSQPQPTDATAATMLVLKALDSTDVVNPQTGNCNVTVTTDKDALVQDVDRLRTIGFLNDSFSDEHYENNPALLFIIIALQASSAATQGFFEENTSSNTCYFKQYLSYADTYGNIQTTLVYTFDFDRDTYKKINWTKFIDANITKVSRHFKTTSIMDAMMQIAVQSNSSN